MILSVQKLVITIKWAYLVTDKNLFLYIESNQVSIKNYDLLIKEGFYKFHGIQISQEKSKA